MQTKNPIHTVGLVILGLLIISFTASQQSKYYSFKNGNLSFIPDERGNIIPDFSRVGYHQGDSELPQVKVVKTISAAAAGSSQEIIQDAINEVSMMKPGKDGFRGAILLKKGTYNIPESINIKTSGIVLRGEGMGKYGTKLVATGKGKRTLIVVSGEGSPREVKGSRTTVVDDYIPVGQFYVNVENPENFKIGDEIIIYRPGTDAWIKICRWIKLRKGKAQSNGKPMAIICCFSERLLL